MRRNRKTRKRQSSNFFLHSSGFCCRSPKKHPPPQTGQPQPPKSGQSSTAANKDRLYRCLDYLIAKKDELEKHLKARWGELFSATYDILLYDLTSTYFEGEAAGNPQAKRGYSRDHRPDCKQVVIALIVSFLIVMTFIMIA